MPYSVDDFGSKICHAGIVPSNLAKVKPNNSTSCNFSWHWTHEKMKLDRKPYGDIAHRLRWHRALMGLDQQDYAKKAGLKRSQLSNWEAGNTRLSLDGAIALRKTYGLSLDFMFEGIADALPMTLRSAWMERPDVMASK